MLHMPYAQEAKASGFGGVSLVWILCRRGMDDAFLLAWGETNNNRVYATGNCGDIK